MGLDDEVSGSGSDGILGIFRLGNKGSGSGKDLELLELAILLGGDLPPCSFSFSTK